MRGNRIYEGTNEINRILTPTMMLRKAMKGELPFMEKTMALFQQLLSGELTATKEEKEPLKLIENYIEVAKKATLLTTGIAVQKFQQEIKTEQEVLMHLADMMIPIYILESALLRAQKQQSMIYTKLTLVLLYEASELLSKHAKEVIFASSDADEAMKNYKGINRLFQLPYLNLKELRREIANHFITKNKYELN